MNTNNTVKKALSFVKGLTNSPSDFISSDDELTESAGMIMKNGEMMPIQKPAFIADFQYYTLLFVHKINNNVNYILYNKQQQSIVCKKKEKDNFIEIGSCTLSSVPTFKSAESIGQIVILVTNKQVIYLRLKGEKYIFTLNDMPKPICYISFYHNSDYFYKRNLTEVERTPCDISNCIGDISDKKAYYDDEGNFITAKETPSSYKTVRNFKYCNILGVSPEHVSEFNDTVQGHVAETINWAKEKGFFAFPFFIRYALKLYDGTYKYISTPMLCMPCVDRNFRMGHPNYNSTLKRYEIAYKDTLSPTHWMYDIQMSILEYAIYVPNSNDEFWSDLISGVVVFASEPVLPFKLDGDYSLKSPDDVYKEVFFNAAENAKYQAVGAFDYNCLNPQGYGTAKLEIVPTYKSRKQIMKDLLDVSSRFYKLFEIPLAKCDGIPHFANYVADPNSETEYIHNGDLLNLTENEMLSNDDYYGWTQLLPEKVFSYNKRLNMIGVKRFPALNNQFINNVNGSSSTREMMVNIINDSCDTWVRVYAADHSWFFYPDPNAKTLLVLYKNADGSTIYYKRSLTIHPRLNGAYSFDALVDEYDSVRKTVDYDNYNFNLMSPEILSSQIFTSVVNNPFVFQANGDNTVGTGSILNIVANTEPISQGQFGQYPLIVFTTEGIYALSVNDEGLYASSYPMSREVCNNAESITPTDRLVFFTSEKGLMAISGGAVQCVSTQLSGPTPNAFKVIGDGDFRKFLANCRIAYDYRESLLRIYSPDYIYHYVYNITDQTFAKAENEEGALLAVASSYPDNLVQEVDGKVYSMLDKPDINADQRTYSGTFITRPLKLGSSLELKTIRQILHFFNSGKGTMKLRVFGSNDCRTWRELKSIHGKPWLFYTLQYDLSNLRASDSFAGTVLAVETRFNDKMR